MMAKKVMRLIDPSTGMMECKVCGHRHCANLVRYEQGTFYRRGSWQCINGCKLEDLQDDSETEAKGNAANG